MFFSSASGAASSPHPSQTCRHVTPGLTPTISAISPQCFDFSILLGLIFILAEGSLYSSMIYLLYICMCLVCLHVCAPCMCLVHTEVRRGPRPHRTGVTHGCMSPCGCREPNPGPLLEQPVPLSAELAQ